MPQDDLINKLTGYFLGKEATSRTTQAPIIMGIPRPKIKSYPPQEPIGGSHFSPEYFRILTKMLGVVEPTFAYPKGKIEISYDEDKPPNLEDFSTVLGHEVTHSVLEGLPGEEARITKGRAKPPGIPSPIRRKLRVGIAKNRAGDVDIEEQAYGNIFQQGAIPEWTEQNQETWANEYKKRYPQNIKNLIDQVVRNVKSAKQFGRSQGF